RFRRKPAQDHLAGFAVDRPELVEELEEALAEELVEPRELGRVVDRGRRHQVPDDAQWQADHAFFQDGARDARQLQSQGQRPARSGVRRFASGARAARLHQFGAKGAHALRLTQIWFRDRQGIPLEWPYITFSWTGSSPMKSKTD